MTATISTAEPRILHTRCQFLPPLPISFTHKDRSKIVHRLVKLRRKNYSLIVQFERPSLGHECPAVSAVLQDTCTEDHVRCGHLIPGILQSNAEISPHSPNLINISIPLHKQIQKLTLQNWKSCSLGELAWDASILSYHLWQLGGKDMLGEGKSWENLKFSKVTFKYPPTHLNLDPQIESGIIQNCKVCSL